MVMVPKKQPFSRIGSRGSLACIAALLLCPLAAALEATETKEMKETGGQTNRVDPLPLDSLRIFAEVFSRIKQGYVEPVEDDFLLEHAIRGMLSGLDPHSVYLERSSYKDLQEDTSGEFTGLGIEVGMDNGLLTIISPIDDTPAQRAGLQAGDVILRIDGNSTSGLSLNESVQIMRGRSGTKVTLTIGRKGEVGPLDIDVTRAVIQLKSVKSKTLEDAYILLRISSFQEHTSSELLRAIEALQEEMGNKIQGAILDLRNNPGGILSAAVSISDLFLDSGTIVYTEGRLEGSNLSFSAKPGDVLEGLPMVVLVNAGTASASEILAGSLQDHKRAVIMGEPTFGKGSVQTILNMKGNTALKLTTARYYKPSGRSIQAEGITPDILIENARISALGSSASVKEANLPRHLENPNAPTKAAKDTSGKGTPGDLSSADYLVTQALNLLKGLAIARKK